MRLSFLAGVRPPEWVGWLVLGGLVAVFGALAWWLFFSPLPARRAPAAPRVRNVARWRRVMAALVLLAGALLVVGARWDELWHRTYGLPLGEDLLWPPHLLIYASFALSCLFAAFGVRVVLLAEGSLRERVRAEPLLALLGLLGAYQLASVPSDVLWHEIIGPDLMAASLPHVVMLLGTGAVQLVGVALALSGGRQSRWLSQRIGVAEWVSLGLLALLGLGALQLFTTDWEWTQRPLVGRPVWQYPVTVLLIGALLSHLALHAIRRAGAATALAVAVLVVHAATVLIDRILLPPGPALAAHLLLVPPAVALDAWYARRMRAAGTIATQVGGAVVYAGVFLLGAGLYVGRAMPWVVLGQDDWLVAVLVGLPATVVVALVASRVGRALAGTMAAPPRDTVAPTLAGQPLVA
jgi:hypothetical protein